MNKHRTKILITIDTEFSIGGYFKNRENKPVPAERRIYCRIKGKDYGINLIMDILDEHDLTGIFFVETEARFYFGEREIIDVIQHVKSRGHEVQLHTHPNFLSFKGDRRTPDDMRKYSIEEQTSIIGEALTFLSSHGVGDILAHRAGGFYSDLNTLKATKENGIIFNSNYNMAFSNCSYISDYPYKNDIFLIDDVYEVPVTCYREIKLRKEWNPFQIDAASFSEVKKSLNHYYSNGTEVITFITHSFEFVKTFDLQCVKMTPKKILIRRFEKICRHLATNQDKFQTVTFKELNNLIKSKDILIREEKSDFYKSSLTMTLRRYLENYLCTKFNM